MQKNFILSALLLAVSVTAGAGAAPPEKPNTPTVNAAPAVFEDQSYIDANRLFEIVSNVGILGQDLNSEFGKTEGVYFPYSGYPQFPAVNTLCYSSGLWLGGKVGSEVRVAVAEYSAEYTPGPMANGSYLPDSPDFKVYKLDATSGPGDPDYDNWPIDQGAPLNNVGEPLKLGDQTLWCVYNDARSALHDYSNNPLGVEVRQSVWGSDEPGQQTTVYVKYLLYNKGGNQIDDFYIGFWADGDLGAPRDDLVGCDSLANAFYFINEGADDDYGATPPAWGARLMSGPLVPAAGEAGVFDGAVVPNHRNLPITSFLSYSLGSDPDVAEHVYYNLQGLDKYGNEMYNPTNGQPTRFAFSGDPVAGTGWIDDSPGDKRTLIAMGPISFAPGDSQQVVLKFAAGIGSDALSSLTTLRQYLYGMGPEFPAPTFSPCSGVATLVTDYGDLWNVVALTDEPWLAGYDWGGRFLMGGVDLAENLFGSSLTQSDLNDVEIRFSHNLTQFAYRYLWNTTPELDYAGYFEVPFTVWDVTNNRQLNVFFTEDANSTVFDSTWSPTKNSIDPGGGQELIVITNSDYSGYTPGLNPHDYQNSNLSVDANALDLQYVVWPMVRSYAEFSDLAEGDLLRFERQTLNLNGDADTLYFVASPETYGVTQELDIVCEGTGDRILAFDLVEGDHFDLYESGSIFSESEPFRATVRFSPGDFGSFVDRLLITDLVTGTVAKEVVLIGEKNQLQTKAIIEPEPMLYIYNWAIETVESICFFGDFNGAITTSDVNLATVRLVTPGGDVPLLDASLYPGHGAFYSAVVGLTFDARDFVVNYGLALGTNMQPYSVVGEFDDGTPFEIAAQVLMKGHQPGDVDHNGKISITDAVFIVNYIFDGGQAPEPLIAGDVDCNQQVTIGDAVYLIGYIFAGGPAPCDH